MANWDDRMFNGRIFAQNGALEEPSLDQYLKGLEYLGDATPSFGLHNALWQYQDKQRDWLFKQIKNLLDLAGVQASPSVTVSLRDAVQTLIAAEAKVRATADSQEAAERGRVDTALQNSIQAEAQTRGQVDTSLSQAIQAEGSERARVDNALQAGINAANAERFRVDSVIIDQYLPNKVDRNSGFNQLGNHLFFAGAVGYCRLPNGLILQWGNAISGSNGLTNVGFPITFPSFCAYVGISEGAASGWYANLPFYPTTHGVHSKFQNAFVAASSGSDGAGNPYPSAGLGFLWFAIGY